jgi:hypothetical protein
MLVALAGRIARKSAKVARGSRDIANWSLVGKGAAATFPDTSHALRNFTAGRQPRLTG